MNHLKRPTHRLAAALALFTCACLARLSAATITLDASYLLGTVSPSNPNSVDDHLEQVQFLVDAYNLGTLEGTSLGDNPDDPNPAEEYVLYRPDGAPAMLANPTIHAGAKVETDDPVVALNGFTYQYILFKQNNDAWVYYIGGIAGSDSINWGGNPLTDPDAGNEDGSEISHYVLFNKSGVVVDPHGVPDGGTTVLLVGLGLVAMAVSARPKKTA